MKLRDFGWIVNFGYASNMGIVTILERRLNKIDDILANDRPLGFEKANETIWARGFIQPYLRDN